MPIFVTESGIVNDGKLTQPINVLMPILVTVLPIITLVKLTQPLNKPLDIIKQFGNVNDSKLTQPINVSLPMVVIDELLLIGLVVIFSQPRNTSVPKIVTLSGIVIVFNSLQL